MGRDERRCDAGGSGGGAGKASFHDLSFTHNIDKASPVLLQACATGVHLKEATITHRKAGKGQQEFLIVKMNDVIITGVTHGDTSDGGHAGERDARRLPRSTSSTSRKSPTGRSSRAFTSSTTSRPTRKGDPSGGDAAAGMEQSPENDRALSLDEAISIAIVLQQNEQWAAAADIYRSILEVAPDHADALHYSGVLAHQQARSEQAVALIERSLELEPDRADWHSNLGIVLQDRLELDEAIAAYQRAIALDPDHANAHNNLGVVLRAQGKLVEAEAAYRAAIRLNPEHSDAYNNLGVLLNSQKRSREAAVCFSRVITFRPKDPEARRLLALAHCTLGEVDKAVEVFEEWLEEEPDHPDRPAHARGLLGPGCPAAGIGRVHREDLRQLRRQLRFQARQAVVPRAGAGRGDAGAIGCRGVEEPRRARCRLRHRAVRTARRPVCAAIGGSRPVRRHARPGTGSSTSTTSWSRVS